MPIAPHDVCVRAVTRLAIACVGVWLCVTPLIGQTTAGQPSPVCHECFWKIFPPEFRTESTAFYTRFVATDPLVAGDVDYILWRSTGVARCVARQRYRHVAEDSRSPFRVLSARAMLGFTGPECQEDGRDDLRAAARAARELSRKGTALSLETAAAGRHPRFADEAIRASLHVPAGATTFVLGATRLEVAPGTRIGAQVERVARDWVSYQMQWNRDGRALARDQILDYHEGAFTRAVLDGVNAQVFPLSGTPIARNGGHWFAPDENGLFRFEVLEDKVQYPTSHVSGNFGWLEDTHGISAIAGQALERGMQLVIGCGDSEGKAEAAFHLAQRGVHVVMPADRFQDLLLGYRGPGVILGGAPVRQVKGKSVLGDQPVAFSVREPIVVSDTKRAYPVQYYDAPARYFRRLSQSVPLNLVFVDLDDDDQIDRVLSRADAIGATAVGVRVMTGVEDERLRVWLKRAAQRRAVLFHSALYPYAQGLFRDFPRQVTFGDLHPRFHSSN